MKTDFDDFASKIRGFESKYTIGQSLKDFFRLFTNDASRAYQLIDSNPSAARIILVLKNVKLDHIDKLKEFETGSLNGYLDVVVKNAALITDDRYGAVNVGDIEITIDTDILLTHEALLSDLS